MSDILRGDLLAHGFLKGDANRIDACHMGEACLQKLFAVADTACYQTDGDTSRLREDSHRELTHQRLAVSRAFACDDEVGILDDFVEADGIKQELYTRLTICI